MNSLTNLSVLEVQKFYWNSAKAIAQRVAKIVPEMQDCLNLFVSDALKYWDELGRLVMLTNGLNEFTASNFELAIDRIRENIGDLTTGTAAAKALEVADNAHSTMTHDLYTTAFLEQCDKVLQLYELVQDLLTAREAISKAYGKAAMKEIEAEYLQAQNVTFSIEKRRNFAHVAKSMADQAVKEWEETHQKALQEACASTPSSPAVPVTQEPSIETQEATNPHIGRLAKLREGDKQRKAMREQKKQQQYA